MDSLALDIDLESISDLSVDVAAIRLPGEYIKLVAGETRSAVDPKDIGIYNTARGYS